jgi:SAM-dependent methyltransferase
LKKDKEYSNLWKSTFDSKDVFDYDSKWFKNFNKNIKHIEFLDIIKNYLIYEMTWLDAPVGSGRFMREIDCKKKYGFDYSQEFLKFITKFGIEPIYGDINQFKFIPQYDFVTCFNMLFAFSNPLDVISNLSNGCTNNGFLIFDLINDDYINRFGKNHKLDYPYVCSTEEVITNLTNNNFKLIKISYADFWDNLFFINLYKSYPRLYKILNSFYFKLCPKFVFKIFTSIVPSRYFLKKIYIFKKIL